MIVSRSGVRVEVGSAYPARFRHVDRDVDGAAVLDLDVRVALLAVAAHAQGLVDVVAERGAGGSQPLRDLLQAVHLEADVVDAAPLLAALHARHRVVLEVEDGEVEVAVTQVVAAGVGVVDLADFLHPEHVDVEARGLVRVLGRESDVLDLRHDALHGPGVRGRGARFDPSGIVSRRPRRPLPEPRVEGKGPKWPHRTRPEWSILWLCSEALATVNPVAGRRRPP